MAALQCELCGGKLVGKPGGMFECDSCGMEYSTEWAKAKIQEIKGTVQVEGTVEVTGSVKVDGAVEVKGSVSKDSLLRRAQLALEDKNWKTAAEYYEKTLDADPECADAYFGLAMCQAGVTTLEELVYAGNWEHRNYVKGKRFASAALLAQVEQLEQAYLQRKREEEEKARIAREEERIAREKWEEEDRIARQESKQRLKPIRDRLRKVSHLLEAGSHHTVGLKADGTVIATRHTGASFRYKGQCRVHHWRDIVAVSAGEYHTVGLKADGTVVATDYFRKSDDRDDYHGQCDVSAWRDIVQVSAGDEHTVGLKADGTVVTVGRNSDGQRNVSDWRLFQQLDTLEQEREEEARILRERREAGLCQHCGGTLKGLFGKKCTSCGKPKDY